MSPDMIRNAAMYWFTRSVITSQAEITTITVVRLGDSTVAITSASKVKKISRTVSSCAARALADRLVLPPRSYPGMRERWTRQASPPRR